jgi:hypothetical protein
MRASAGGAAAQEFDSQRPRFHPAFEGDCTIEVIAPKDSKIDSPVMSHGGTAGRAGT